MKMIYDFLKKVVLLVLTIFLGASFLYAQDLRLTNQRGVEFSTKPSLSQRMQGVRKIYLFYPRSTAQNDKYVYQNFKVYLQRLGLTVEDRAVSYKTVDASRGNVSAYILSCTEDVSEYVSEMNSLAVVLNIGHLYGKYTGETMTAAFNFIDFFNEYDWQVKIEPANRAESFISQCQSNICGSYSYNSAYAYQPPYITSNYTQYLLRSYIDKGEYSAIEGIYEGDDYTLGVKKGTDGKYYIIYHGSKKGADEWRDGYIKAVLRETATSGVYRATWYGRYFKQMDYKIIFEKGLFTAYDEDNDKVLFLKMYPTSQMESEQSSLSGEWSGTGFALNNGYIVTNYHVVSGAKSIVVYGVKGQMNNGFKADVVATDKTNDLAIVKISEYGFSGFGNIPYAVNNRTLDVGEDVWVLGYPLTQYLGNEIKLTNGLISSKSGFQGDVATYQISAPVQPGNSGGPMFDSKGNVVGIVNAVVPGAENVGYAIKTSYLYNLADSYSISSSIPGNNSISSVALTEKVKRVKDYIFLLICSSNANASTSRVSTTTSTSSSYSDNTSASSSSSTSSGYTGNISSTPGTTTSPSTSSGSSPKMVDLGLSVKWADRNVGATSIESVGAFFSWGETKSKSEFERENYQWFKDNQYSNPGGLSDIGGSTYDPARASFGSSWRMPTEAEIEELITKCTWVWTTSNGVAGYKVTGKNGNSIFLPANGEITEDHTPTGSYWSSEGNPSAAFFSYILHFEKGKKNCADNLRESFGAVRPVSGSKSLPKTERRKADDAYALALQKYSQQDFSGAYEEVEKSLRLHPSAAAHYMRGFIAYYYLNDGAAAKESFLYCLNNGYRMVESRRNYAMALSQNNEYSEAINQYNLLFEEYTTKDGFYVDALYNRALNRAWMEDWDKCASDCRAALSYEGKVDYEYGTIYNELAWAYLNLNQVNQAVEPINKALKLNHNEACIWDTDGEVQYKTGNYEQCIVSMNNAIAIDKAEQADERVNSFLYRGLAKIVLGNLAGGYVDLEKASDLGSTKAADELKKINVASIDFSDNGSYKREFEKVITSTFAGDDIKIVGIELSEEETVMYLQYTNNKYETGGWYAISPDAYIRDKNTGKKYLLLTTQNCALSPYRTPIEKGKTNTFILIFPALPKDASKIDFVESEDSPWKFYNIDLK